MSVKLLPALIASLSRELFANPQGMTAKGGAVTAVANGPILTVTAANNARLNWQSFNIGTGETVVFQQPSSSAIVWNSIGGQTPSDLYGNLQANGIVVLMNTAGFYFGPKAYVKAAGLVVSTAPETPVESGGGPGWQFNGPAPLASIINYGRINAESGGFVYLLGANIENRGSIAAPGGNIVLCAGQSVLLSERPDGRGLSAQVTLPTGLVDNGGTLTADAGTILANAQVINQRGLIQANSVGMVDGAVELYASDKLTFGAHSVTRADGQSTGVSPGGAISIKSGGAFADAQGSLISITGGASGGNAGTIEVSAAEMPSILSRVDGHADNGIGGKLILDPTDIAIGSSGGGSAGSGTVNSGNPSATLSLNVNSAFTGFSQIDLQATRNISLSANTVWDLAASTGISAPGSLLKLEAGNNITLGNGSAILGSDGWSVAMQAGRDFSTANKVASGTGSITLSGTAGLQTGNGDVTLLAGNSVTVNSGYVRTVNGGNISVTGLSGSVKTGVNANGFDFRPTGSGYVVDPNLGGISTANGGSVGISAGSDIISYLPTAGGVQTDAGTGCFGPAAGNVTLSAGHDVVGHYVLTDGAGTIVAGHNAGTLVTPLALSLVSGGWNVTAGNDLLLQEARNPNGIFNDLGWGASSLRHSFDYAPDAYTILTAGHSVKLLGAGLPRYDDSFESSIPCIYPPTLEITAGAGGVTLGSDVILFPSAKGWLSISTTDGGALTSAKPGSDLAQLILSDSGKNHYLQAGDFGITDHAAQPIHLDDTRTVELNVSGDMKDIYLVAAERAEVKIGGNMIDCRFDGQNLHAGDVTSINVAGAIQNRSDFTSVTVNSAPDFSTLAGAYPPWVGSLSTLASQFYYDASTKLLTFQGRMTTDQLQALLNLSTQAYDANGQPMLDANGYPVTKPAQFINASTLQALYVASQNIPTDPESGFRIGGGGAFNVSAARLDLGATSGIVSEGPAQNAALANYFARGANINVDLAGNLDMPSTTISSLNGGTISVLAGGNVTLGSPSFTSYEPYARGIFSTGDAGVTVVAGGDINVSGSHIAAYDGGDVTVRSLHGSVAVGAGGQGSAAVEELYVDPVSRTISSYTTTIPGSGILTTTFPISLEPAFPTSRNTVGNILVETPQGNITATAAGIVQIPLNGSSAKAGVVRLVAGSENASGQVLYKGNIDVSGSGVIGGSVQLNASGSIKGSIVARDNLDISARQSVSVSAFAGGSLSVNAGGPVAGELIGLDAINVSAGVIEAALLSQNIITSGNAASAKIGYSSGKAANATSQNEAVAASTNGLASADDTARLEKGLRQGRGGKAQIERFTGRVTVLPPQ